MSRITLKEVREFAKSLDAGMKDYQKDMAIYEKVGESALSFMNDKHLMGTSDYKHWVYVGLEFDLEAKGILSAECYNDEAMEAFCEKAEEKFEECNCRYTDEYLEWFDKHYPKPEFCFEVPLTRGYSDTSKQTDTTFSSLDLEIAVKEGLDEHFKCGKIYPWMLREICSPSEFGLTEEEFEIEVAGYLY